MSAVIICFALVAILLTGTCYYFVLPFAFNAKAAFAERVSDPKAVQFGELLYDVVGIFPLLFFGAVALSAISKSVRHASCENFSF